VRQFSTSYTVICSKIRRFNRKMRTYFLVIDRTERLIIEL
jgi:hypothetical protein